MKATRALNSPFNIAIPASSFSNTYSLAFDGVDEYVDIGNGINFEYTDAFSYSFWVNPDAVNGSDYLFTKYASGRGILMYLNSPGTGDNFLYFNLYNTNSGSTSTRKRIITRTGSVIPPNVWTNVVVTYDGSGLASGITIYKNGVSQAITITQDNLQNSTIQVSQAAYISGNNFASNFYAGKQDEWAIFNTELSSENALAIYNGGKATDLTPLSPVAWYRMGDNGDYKSPQWLLPNNENKDKVSNYSFEFDGVDDYVDCGNSAALKPNIITVSCWIKGSANSAFTRIISQDGPTGGADAYGFYVTTALNKVVFAIKTDVTGTVTSATSGVVLDNNWHHLVGTYDGSEVILYVDGVAVGSPSAGTSILSYGSGTLTIGCFSEPTSLPSYLFNGNIDEVSIFNSVIPIGDLWDGSGEPTTLPSGAVAHYKMGEEANFTSNWLVDNSALTNYSKRSFAFDGIDDYIDLGASSTVANGSQFTFSFWIKGSAQAPGAKNLFSADSYNLHTLWTAQNSSLYWRNINNVYHLLSSNVLDGDWHHILIIFNPDGADQTIRCFTDGANEVNSTTDSRYKRVGGLYNGALRYIGNRGGGTFPGFNGSIDEFAVWDNDQSANLSSIYNGGVPNDLTSLSPDYWYRMGEDASFNGTDWTVPDNVGSNNGTSNAMTVDSLVGEAPNYSGGGISNAMTIEDRVGNAPNSYNDALSYNMESVDRVTDTP